MAVVSLQSLSIMVKGSSSGSFSPLGFLGRGRNQRVERLELQDKLSSDLAPHGLATMKTLCLAVADLLQETQVRHCGHS